MKIQFKQNGGGIPPFNYYTPITYQGKSSQVTTGDIKDNKDETSTKDILELIKGLKGLPSDIDYFTNRIRQFFANPFTKDNPSSLVSMYASIVRDANRFQFSQTQFQNSKTEISNKGGLDEIAIDPYGRVLAKDENGEIKYLSPTEYYNNRDKYVKVTNDDLLTQRAYNSPLDDNILTIVNSGTGMKTVTDRINSMINSLGTTEYKESNLTNGEKAGFRLLTTLAASAGIKAANIESLYKSELITKDQQNQIEAALHYVFTNLTDSEKALILSKTGDANEAKKYIYSLYAAKSSPLISIENTPYELKNGEDGVGKVKSNPLLQMLNGEGAVQAPFTMVTKDGTAGFNVTASYLPTINNIKSDCSIEELLSNSNLQGMMYMYGRRHITFGDQELSPDDLQHVMYSNQGVSIVYLPSIITSDGARQVNFGVLDEYKQACKDLTAKTGLSSPNLIENEQQLKDWTDILRSHGLDEYIGLDGKADSNLFSLFAVVDAYATDKINLDDKSNFIEEIDKPDQKIQDMLIKGLSTNYSSNQKNKNEYNYKVDVKDHIQPFEFRYDKVYKANVFIPITNDPNAAIRAYGDQITQDQVSEYEKLTEMWNKRNNQNTNSSDVL